MTFSDVVALYAAGLSTAFAFYQFAELRRSARAFAVRVEYVGLTTAQMNFEITNTLPHPTLIHWAGVGYGYRPWLAPWRQVVPYSRALRVVSGGYLNSTRRRETLEAGERVEGFLNRKDHEQLIAEMSRKKGFAYRPILWIDHSAGDGTFQKVFNCVN